MAEAVICPKAWKNWLRWIWQRLVTGKLRMNITAQFASKMAVDPITTGYPTNCAIWQRLMRFGIVDIYVNYSSDGTAYWRVGGDAAVALIGPGVDSSHHYERTHTDALNDTTKWLLAYLLN